MGNNQDIKNTPLGYFARRACTKEYIRRGLQCCLFYKLGNTRASVSGTTIVQSHFYSVYKWTKMNHAYIKKKQYLCSQWYMTDTLADGAIVSLAW